jgi:hypothetical protein
METTDDDRGRIRRLSSQATLQPSIIGRCANIVLACLIVAGCTGEKTSSLTPKSATVDAQPGLDASAVLKHRIECRALGVQAEKEKFPEGMNSVKSLNQGFMYFESEFGYNERLNTCIVLSGFQLTDFKTKSVTSYQATLTDLLTNKILGSYLLLAGQLAPASTSREAFIAKVRELLGEPVPLWLTQGPIR